MNWGKKNKLRNFLSRMFLSSQRECTAEFNSIKIRLGFLRSAC